jgi:hypothetical protein
LYFLLAYTAGFLFGTLRELCVVPRLGSFWATLLETPLMLIAIVLAARYVIGRYEVPPSTRQRLAIGGIAFALLMLAEIGFSGVLRGWSLGRWLAHLGTADGAISLAMFVLFAFLPALVRRGVSVH